MKKIFSLLMSIAMFFSLTVPVEALESVTPSDCTLEPYILQVDDQTTVTAYVPDEYRNSISQEELLDIAIDEGLQNGDSFQIHYVEFAEASYAEPMPAVILPPILDMYPTTTTRRGSEYAAEKFFITSVAKGQSFTLSQEFIRKVSSTFSVAPYEVTTELKCEYTASVSVTYTFNGPSENSAYNSREFNVRIYRQAYDYTQQHYSGAILVGTRTGVVNKPTKHAVYSVDSYQS
jgi:hypothetical protein